MHPERPYLDAPLGGYVYDSLSRRVISGSLLGSSLLSGALAATGTTSLVEHVSPPSEVLFLEAGEESPPAPFDVPNYTVENRLPEDCTNFCYKTSCNGKSGQYAYAAMAMSTISDTPNTVKISALELPLL